MTRIGVISDTHGLLRLEALEALAGSDLIIHAGDVGKPEVLSALRDLAPVRAVRGNVDRGDWAEALPLTEVVERAGFSTCCTMLASLIWTPVRQALARSFSVIHTNPLRK